MACIRILSQQRPPVIQVGMVMAGDGRVCSLLLFLRNVQNVFDLPIFIYPDDSLRSRLTGWGFKQVWVNDLQQLDFPEINGIT